MNYSTLKECINLCYDANVCLFIWGHTGLGKSSVVNQVAIKNHMGFVDFRLSQVEAADLRGLPYRDEVSGRTRYMPPGEMPTADMTWAEYMEALRAEKDDTKRVILSVKLQPRLQTGIVFLDEMPRAPEDVQQAAFQFVLDRRIGEYVLPPGWGICCAGNYLRGYQQSGFTDPAFLDRFCHVMLPSGDTTFSEWCDYMTERHGDDAAEIIEFTSDNVDYLDGKRSGELDFAIQPSRRSWEMVMRIRQVFKGQAGKYTDKALLEVTRGLLGTETQIAFDKYKCPVKPREIVDNGVKAMQMKLNPIAKNRSQLAGLTWSLMALLRTHMDEEKYTTVALDYAEWMATNPDILDKDLCLSFCRAVAGKGGGSEGENIRAAALSNKKVQELINRVQKNNPKQRQRFINRLKERPALQKIMQHVSWGQDVDEDAIA